MAAKKARLNLEIDAATLDRMHQLKKQIDAGSITSVVRLALHVLQKILEYQSDGAEIVVRSKDGRERSVEFFLKGL